MTLRGARQGEAVLALRPSGKSLSTELWLEGGSGLSTGVFSVRSGENAGGDLDFCPMRHTETRKSAACALTDMTFQDNDASLEKRRGSWGTGPHIMLHCPTCVSD